jgi:hypothetical protein
MLAMASRSICGRLRVGMITDTRGRTADGWTSKASPPPFRFGPEFILEVPSRVRSLYRGGTFGANRPTPSRLRLQDKPR